MVRWISLVVFSLVFLAACPHEEEVNQGELDVGVSEDTGAEEDTGDDPEPDVGGDADTDGGDGPDADVGGEADTGGDELPYSEFVMVDPEDPRFLLRGEPFYFAGTNLYWLVQWRTYNNSNVDDALDVCEELGIRVIRLWGFADGEEWTNSDDPAIMQYEPGVYNESAFEALDYIIAEAGERDIKLIIPLVNYWDDFGGMRQYARWAGGEGREFFYTDDAARQLYRDYVEYVLTRENTITGVEYREDPTIFAWELANEANAYFDPNAADGVLEDWYQEMSAYIRSLDSNHLIATGEEGFDVPVHRDAYGSYTNGWVLSGEAGTSYVNNTALPNIDFAGAHLYPDVWGFSDALEDGRQWILDHVELAHEAGKPFVLGEFGNSDRSVYAEWLETIEESGVAGSLLWELVPASRGATSNMHVVYPDDAELVEVFREHAERMNARSQE